MANAQHLKEQLEVSAMDSYHEWTRARLTGDDDMQHISVRACAENFRLLARVEFGASSVALPSRVSRKESADV